MSTPFLSPLSASPLAADPATGHDGDFYVNTVSGPRYYLAGAWHALGGSSGVPTLVSSTDTFTVASSTQVYAPLDIVVNGEVVLDGEMVMS